MSEHFPYPDARTKRHFELLESNPAYKARYVRRVERRRAEMIAAFREAKEATRRIIREKMSG